jgi:hypothetical protein
VARRPRFGYMRLMNAPVFDRLASLDALKAGGVSEEHARAHASALDAAMRESIVTKDDLAREMAKIDLRLGQIEARIAQGEARLEARLDVKLAETKSEILRWMFAAMVGQTALIIAVVKLV